MGRWWELIMDLIAWSSHRANPGFAQAAETSLTLLIVCLPAYVASEFALRALHIHTVAPTEENSSLGWYYPRWPGPVEKWGQSAAGANRRDFGWVSWNFSWNICQSSPFPPGNTIHSTFSVFFSLPLFLPFPFLHWECESSVWNKERKRERKREN